MPISCASRSMNGRWPARIFARASVSENHAARSTSAKRALRPLRGGHSSSKVLETSFSGSKSPSTAQALTRLPPAWTISPNGWNSPCGRVPVSSSNSRRATASGSSPSAYSPFGIDQAPRSFLAQNGPPGWTSSTEMSGPARRYIKRPALRLGMGAPFAALRSDAPHSPASW